MKEQIFTPIVGDAAIAKAIGIGVATLRRNPNAIPHKVVGKQRITSIETLNDWLAGRIAWPPSVSIQSPGDTKQRGNAQALRQGRPTKAQSIARRNISQGGVA